MLNNKIDRNTKGHYNHPPISCGGVSLEAKQKMPKPTKPGMTLEEQLEFISWIVGAVRQAAGSLWNVAPINSMLQDLIANIYAKAEADKIKKNVEGFAFRAAVYAIRNAMRKASFLHEVQESDYFDPSECAPSPEDQLLRKEEADLRAKDMSAFVSNMPYKERLVFLLLILPWVRENPELNAQLEGVLLNPFQVRMDALVRREAGEDADEATANRPVPEPEQKTVLQAVNDADEATTNRLVLKPQNIVSLLQILPLIDKKGKPWNPLSNVVYQLLRRAKEDLGRYLVDLEVRK